MKKSIKFKLISAIITTFVLAGLIVCQFIYYFNSNYTIKLILNNPFRLFLSAFLLIILLFVIISIIMIIHNKETLATNSAKYKTVLYIIFAIAFVLMLSFYFFITSQEIYKLNEYKKPFLSVEYIENGNEITKEGLSERDLETRDKIQIKNSILTDRWFVSTETYNVRLTTTEEYIKANLDVSFYDFKSDSLAFQFIKENASHGSIYQEYSLNGSVLNDIYVCQYTGIMDSIIRYKDKVIRLQYTGTKNCDDIVLAVETWMINS
jgi:hypothetical protein